MTNAAGALLPLTMLSGRADLDQGLAGWSLAGPGGDGERRCFHASIRFERPFDGTPLVQAALTGFDIDNRDTARLLVEVAHITPQGFELRFATWGHTRVYRVAVSWFALGH